MDYYSEAREIGTLLEAEGFSDTAMELGEAIAGGATATEILMGLRHHLEMATKMPVSDTTRKRISALVGEIDKMLG